MELYVITSWKPPTWTWGQKQNFRHLVIFLRVNTHWIVEMMPCVRVWSFGDLTWFFFFFFWLETFNTGSIQFEMWCIVQLRYFLWLLIMELQVSAGRVSGNLTLNPNTRRTLHILCEDCFGSFSIPLMITVMLKIRLEWCFGPYYFHSLQQATKMFLTWFKI